MREIWIAGFPSFCGGADTELDHLIDLWLGAGVGVHLVPMCPGTAGVDERMRASVIERGAQVHGYNASIFAGKTVASFCNGEFLKRLPQIARLGRPRQVIWFNCMTWTFPAELSAHAAGLIDLFGFQTRYQEKLLRPALEKIAPVRSFDYRPFFNCDRVPWAYKPINRVYGSAT